MLIQFVFLGIFLLSLMPTPDGYSRYIQPEGQVVENEEAELESETKPVQRMPRDELDEKIK